VARKSNDRRWDSKFGRFVQAFGAGKLADRLNVTPGAVYQWINGNTSPSKKRAFVIFKIARGHNLSMEEIYRHARPARARVEI
jgi:DNA-binding transcriptional regulator YdaS (Cro superfamily)